MRRQSINTNWHGMHCETTMVNFCFIQAAWIVWRLACEGCLFWMMRWKCYERRWDMCSPQKKEWNVRWEVWLGLLSKCCDPCMPKLDRSPCSDSWSRLPSKKLLQSPCIADNAVCCSDRIDASERKMNTAIAELLILTLIVILPACLTDLWFSCLQVLFANNTLCWAFCALH